MHRVRILPSQGNANNESAGETVTSCCQLSLNPKIGPEIAHTTRLPVASRKAMGSTAAWEAALANRVNNERCFGGMGSDHLVARVLGACGTNRALHVLLLFGRRERSGQAE